MPKRKPSIHKSAPKRSVAQRETDLQIFAELWREGATQLALVQWVRVNRPYTLSKTAIHNDLADLKARWRAESVSDMGDRIARQLASIDAQEAEAWQAWRKSKGEVTEVVQEQSEDGGTGKTKTPSHSRAVVRKTMSHGDPRYMGIISSCIEARNRLLGLTKNRVELSGPGGGPVEVGGLKDFDMVNIDKFLEAQYAKRIKVNGTG